MILMIVALFSCKTQNKEAGFSIPIEKYSLANGLTVILHEDHSDPIASVAIYYHVGFKPRNRRQNRICSSLRAYDVSEI